MQEPPADIPEECICPISQSIMADPVVCADGHSYERTCIEAWLASGRGTSPKTNMPLPHTNLVPNLNLRSMIESLRHRTPPERRRTFQLKELEDLESIVASLAPDSNKDAPAQVVRKEESSSKANIAGLRRQLFSNESAISWSPSPPGPTASRAEEFSNRRSHGSPSPPGPAASRAEELSSNRRSHAASSLAATSSWSPAASSEKHAAERDGRAEQLNTAASAIERRKAVLGREGVSRTGPGRRRVTFPPAESEAHVVQQSALPGARVSRSSSPARNRYFEHTSCLQATEHDGGMTPRPSGSAVPLWQGASIGSNGAPPGKGVFLSAALPPQQHSGDHWSGAGQTQLLRSARDMAIAPRDSSRGVAPRDSSRTVRQRGTQRSPSAARCAAEGELAGDGLQEPKSRTVSPVRWRGIVEVEATPAWPAREHQRSLSPAQRRPARIAADHACMWRSDSRRSPSPMPLSAARPEKEASRLWVHARESQRSVSPAQQRPAKAIAEHGLTWKMVEPFRCGTPTRQPVWAEGHVRGAWTQSMHSKIAGQWRSPRNVSGNFPRARLL